MRLKLFRQYINLNETFFTRYYTLSTGSYKLSDAREFCTGHDTGLHVWDTEDKYSDMMAITNQRKENACTLVFDFSFGLISPLVYENEDVWTALDNPGEAVDCGHSACNGQLVSSILE